MKYLKPYKQPKPQLGDYVICEESIGLTDSDQLCTKFTKSNIGQCIFINQFVEYYIQYQNVPKELKIYFCNGKEKIFKEKKPNTRKMYKEEIIYWSPNKEDVEIYINTIKYNL